MRLGKEISLLGLDCRTERKLKQIVNPSTYNIIFDRLKKNLPPLLLLLQNIYWLCWVYRFYILDWYG